MDLLIVIHDLEKIGGVSKALVNLLNSINSIQDLKIDLLIFNPNVDNSVVPTEINILKLQGPISTWFSHKNDIKGFNKILWFLYHGISKVFGNRIIYRFLLARKEIKKKYDVAIAYENDLPRIGVKLLTNDYVVKNIVAQKKISFVHNDPYKLGFNERYIERQYSRFDFIACVSKSCKKKFVSLCPQIERKVEVSYNFIDVEKPALIEKKYTSRLNIVSVCRLDNYQKRIDRMIEAVNILKCRGYSNLSVDIYGDGKDKNYLEGVVKELNVGDMVFFKGITNNPIETISRYDLFLMTSDFEAFGLTLKESLAANTPVLSTDFEEAFETLTDGKNCIIVHKDSEAVADAIERIMNNPGLLETMREYIKENPEDNSLQTQQFLNLIDYKEVDSHE